MTTHTGLNVQKRREFQVKLASSENGGEGTQMEKCEFPREIATRFGHKHRNRPEATRNETNPNANQVKDHPRFAGRLPNVPQTSAILPDSSKATWNL